MKSNNKLSEERCMTVRQASEYLHVKPSSIIQLARKGKLKFYQIGKEAHFWRDDLEALADRKKSNSEKKQAAVLTLTSPRRPAPSGPRQTNNRPPSVFACVKMLDLLFREEDSMPQEAKREKRLDRQLSQIQSSRSRNHRKRSALGRPTSARESGAGNAKKKRTNLFGMFGHRSNTWPTDSHIPA